MAVNAVGDALVAKGLDNMQVANCLIMARPTTVEEAEAWMAANEVGQLHAPRSRASPRAGRGVRGVRGGTALRPCAA